MRKNTKVKIEKAKRFVAEDGMSVSAACKKVGFSTATWYQHVTKNGDGGGSVPKREATPAAVEKPYVFTTLPKFVEQILEATDLSDRTKVAMLQAYRRAAV